MNETWGERIVRARTRGLFTAEDRVRAARWSTCAIGELARRWGPQIVRLDDGRPVDATFSDLGTTFFAAVLANDVARAETTLAEIENQAALTSRAAAIRPRPQRRLEGLGSSSPLHRVPNEAAHG
jgi:hypothetical protein